MNRRILIGGLGLVLALLTVSVYARVLGYGFVQFDDDIYITNNPAIRLGLSLEGWRWAWTTLYAAFWHPLTWLSLLADYQIHGLSGPGFHLTNLLIHTLNVVLLFGLLVRLTGAPWRSAWVAAVFAVHPLHVESVAWVAERKDVLSTLFGLGAFLAYGRHVEAGGRRWLGVSWGLYVASLMAKPMLVTFPVLLLVLDVWPLRRSLGWRAQLLEKGPFLLPALVFSGVAILAQQASGAIPADPGPLGFRMVTAILAAGWYLFKTVWPSGLAPFYPWQEAWPAVPVACAALALAAGTWIALAVRRSRPWLTAGWFWFGIALLPVSGLIRVGSHAWADRYMYLPIAGLAWAAAWEVGERLKAHPAARRPVAWAGLMAVLALAAAAWAQTGWWRDSETLFRRTLAVTAPSPMIESNLSAVLYQAGKLDEAEAHARRAVSLNPGSASGHNNLGAILGARGRWEEAAGHYGRASALRPDYAEALANWGGALLQLDRPAEAVPILEKAAGLAPDDSKALSNLGGACFLLGRDAEAAAWFGKALEADPRSAVAAFNLGAVRERQGRWSEAAAWFGKAAALKPGDSDALRRRDAAREKAGGG